MRWVTIVGCCMACMSSADDPEAPPIASRVMRMDLPIAIHRRLDVLFVVEMISGIVRTTLGSPCFEGPLADLDPVAPGLQPDCTAWYEFPEGGEVVPACSTTLAGPCFQPVDDRQNCPYADAARIELRLARTDLPDNTHLIIECVVR
jgi:hypothetical protein